MDERLRRLKRSGDRVGYLQALIRAGKIKPDQLRLAALFADADAAEALDLDESRVLTVIDYDHLIFVNQIAWANQVAALVNKRQAALMLSNFARWWLPCPNSVRCEISEITNQCNWFPHHVAGRVADYLEKYYEHGRVVTTGKMLWGNTTFGQAAQRIFAYGDDVKCITWALRSETFPIYRVRHELLKDIYEGQ